MSEEAHSEVREVQEIPPAKKQKLNDEQATSSNTGEAEVDSIQDTADDKFGSEDSYGNFVTPEELERLKEFKVLDEVKSNDEDSNDEESDSSDGLPEEEIEKMLEEDLPEDFKGAPKQKEKAYITRQKIVLEEKGVNHFEVLPLDWTMVRHVSGMPVYMHRATRVCTLSKPYFLGKGNTRRHEIPISAIPCYAYRRALEEEEKQKEIDKKIAEQIRAGTWVNTQPKTENNDNSQDSMDSSQLSMDSSQPSMDSSQPSDVTEPAPTCEVTVKDENNVKQEVQCPYMNGHASLKNMTHENLNSGEATANSNCSCLKEVLPEEKTEEMVEENPDTASKETEESVDQKPDVSVDSEIAGPSSEGTSQESTSNGDVQVPLNRQPVVLPGGIVMPPPRVETINTSWKTQHLTAEQINDYCKKLFKFKTVYIMHFKRWADRRKYTKARKTLQYPTLPEGTKLITIPAQPTASTDDNNAAGKASKRDWVMNMNGRSYLSVFHEYVCRALQKQPVYEFRQLENAATPYQATVYIGGMQYGVGHGSSKRQAKSAAARSSIHILIPEMRDQLEPAAQPDPEPDFTFFDYVGIEDPRITEFCAATFEPSPHAILRTCLLRNFGAGDRHIHTEMKKLEYQKIELTMKVGKHTATVVSKNKKTAKQRASQAILQALHPHVRSWGSLLRLYGSRSVKSCKEKKLEEQQITLLQDKARHNEPNYAVLDKLRNEMRKLRERDEAVVPIGTLLVHDDLPTHSGSNLNNVDL